MQPTINYQELCRLYGFAPKSDSAYRLTELVVRQESDVGEIARIVNQDPGLLRRLLRIANPEAKSEADYSITNVDDALMREGMGCILVLSMSNLLSHALTRSFETMLGLTPEAIPPSLATPLRESHLQGSISFTGRAIGRVYLRLSRDSARTIAAGILGIAPSELTDASEIRDATGEMLNIMTGNFKSCLCDAGLECRLQPPEVRLTDDFHIPRLANARAEHLAFRADKIQFFVDVTANPWNRG